MRIAAILTALVVAVSLYFLVFERAAVLDVAGSAGAAVGTPAQEAPDQPSGVSVVAVSSTARSIGSAVVLRGRTEAARQVEVRAETSGKVTSEPLRKGSFVAADEVLCSLDPGTREVALAEAQARLAEARAGRPEAEARIAEAKSRLTEAQIDQRAAASLSEGGFASQMRVASTDAGVESAKASIAAAESGLESVVAAIQGAEAAVAAAETEIARLDITAPFSGLLETDTAELGEFLQPAGLCATVIQLDPIELVGFVPETEVARVELGAPAQARLASGGTIDGTVSFLSRAADPETRTFRAEIRVPNPELAIRDGQTVEVAISAAGQQAHLLPQSALTLNDEGDLGVRLVSADTTAAFVPVELLRDTPQGVFVAGLPDQADVIVVGQEYVSDGVPLDVTYRETAG
ncbi:efflux RND transporter periplasmic adaptor subunit [Palleronia rufa]|uniref:efflux RND transporter periplasmic adaptor subunit n=1 Tax=Palleronia rufa TaxID=1530186 RepID=UPI00056673E3|nr:efflux RND transporter periplasmic adaptor subunit [Palleronia rufa]